MEKNKIISFPKLFLILGFFAVLILIILTIGNIPMTDKNQKDLLTEYYFSSPQEAVQIITELLKKDNFRILAKYYDITNSSVKKISELESGDFFIRKTRPELTHPAEFWRYKHPFAPGYSFSSSQSTSSVGIYIIEVSISIDQGIDVPVQKGLSYFKMIKSDKGWKILPDPVQGNEHHSEVPVVTQ